MVTSMLLLEHAEGQVPHPRAATAQATGATDGRKWSGGLRLNCVAEIPRARPPGRGYFAGLGR